MPAVANEDYKRRVRMGYQVSNDGLRITIPDSVIFPASIAHCHLRDLRTLVVDQDRSADTTWSQPFSRSPQIQGCRYFTIPGVRNIGPHFRITPVQYRVDGRKLLVTIPDENDRLPVQRRGKMRLDAKTAAKGIDDLRIQYRDPPVAQVGRTIEEGRLAREAAPKATVLVDIDGYNMEFRVPVADLMPVVMGWRDKRYGG